MFRLVSQSASKSKLNLSSPKNNRLSIINNNNNVRFNFATVAMSSSDADTAENTGKFMLILGKPGGGKGTISNKILNDFPSFKHLSTGDLLRKHVRDQTPIGLEAKKHMDNGDLVPDEIMIQLVLNDAFADSETDETHDEDKSLLLDGFPRTMEQAVALDQSLNVDMVVDLDVPVDTIVERISDRYVCIYACMYVCMYYTCTIRVLLL